MELRRYLGLGLEKVPPVRREVLIYEVYDEVVVPEAHRILLLTEIVL